MPVLDQSKTPLFDAVKKYVDDNVVQFHVPGHKQGRGIEELREYIGDIALRMDANGMNDLDYLNNPTGVILESEKLLANAFDADSSFFLVNGTSEGVQAMIMSACSPGEKIIIPRNCHKSALGGIILGNVIPVFIQPEFNQRLGIAMGITVDSVKDTIQSNPDAKALFLINPTYYGAASDIASIIKIAHDKGIAVLADEAHGTHLYFHDSLPMPAMAAGADMSAISMHKTGGSMTQSSALLLKGNMIPQSRARQMLNLTCTTSASYLLMCSIDIARKQLSLRGRDMVGNAIGLSRYARCEINRIDGMYAFGKELAVTPGCFDFDETKLGINVFNTGLTGCQVEQILRQEYNIQVELSDLYNILAIVSLGDSEGDIMKLITALKDIKSARRNKTNHDITKIPYCPEMVVPPREAFYGPKVSLPLESSSGYISGEMLMAYPPGIPVICMGEMITRDIIDYIKILKDEKCTLQGTSDPYANYIQVLSTEK